MSIEVEKSVVEGDCKIADFMGFKRNDATVGEYWARFKHWNIEPFGWFDDEGLKYHSSWDWLMPVVEKIESIWIDGGKTVFKIEGCRVQGFHSVGYQNIDFAVNELDKDNGKQNNLWSAVIKFIQWYNNQPKTTDQ